MASKSEEFIAKAKKTPEIQKELASLPGGFTSQNMPKVAKIAEKHGFKVDVKELETALKGHVKAKASTKKSGELSDSELENVAGGTTCWVSHYTKSQCEGLTSW